MPSLCAPKCLPMPVMLSLASYTLTVTSPHPGTQKEMHLFRAFRLCCTTKTQWPTPVVLTRVLLEMKRLGLAGSRRIWALPLQNLCSPHVRRKLRTSLPRAELQHRQERPLCISPSPCRCHQQISQGRRGTFGDRIIILIPPSQEAERWIGQENQAHRD